MGYISGYLGAYHRHHNDQKETLQQCNNTSHPSVSRRAAGF